jgi:regulatory protein
MQPGIITALEMQKRDKERVNVYLDGEFAFGLPLIEAAQLKKGQHLSHAQIQDLKHKDTVQRAVDRAVRLLARRPYSTSEIRRNLLKHDTPETVVDIALERLSALGYLDDRAFARYWLENRDTFKPRGPVALRHELRQKGIEDSIIDETLESLDVQQAAYRAALSKIRSMRGKTRKEFDQKVGSFLQRRGFTYATCREVLDQIATEMIEQDHKYFAEESLE